MYIRIRINVLIHNFLPKIICTYKIYIVKFLVLYLLGYKQFKFGKTKRDGDTYDR